MDKENMERVYTSSELKLLRHADRLKDATNGIWRPITLQIAPTDACNLKCDFCSVHKREGDTIPIGDLEKCIDDFVDLGIISAEVTGGGDPTMYKDINRLIDYLDNKGVEVGMITNGLRLDRVGREQLDKLTWLRVSLSYLDFLPDAKLDIPDIPGTLGFSYVWNKTSNEGKMKEINGLVQEFGAEYVRIVPNCQNVEEQKQYMASVKPLIDKYPGFFFQTKPYDVHPGCHIGKLKPFLNADGNVYQCSAAPLYTGKFSEDWKICHMRDVKDAWRNLPEMDTSKCSEGKCFYSAQNKLLDGLSIEVPHEKFI